MSRRISPLLRLHLLLGGSMSQVGWVVTFMGLVALWTMGFRDGAGLYGIVSPWSQVDGRIDMVQTRRTHTTRVRGVNYKWFSYTYDVQGRRYRGSATSRDFSELEIVKGRSVPIFFAEIRPAISWPLGPRSVNKIGTLILLFVTLSAFSLVVEGLRRGLRANRLLAHGELADVEILSEKNTGFKVRKQEMMAYELAYAVDGRSYTLRQKGLYRGRRATALQDGLLFDPQRPDKAVALDLLPGRPYLQDGRWQADFKISSLIFLPVFPVLSLGALVYIIAFVPLQLKSLSTIFHVL